jgi:hypothetical protein
MFVSAAMKAYLYTYVSLCNYEDIQS